ncbi:E3 ubiquitin-protein ligase CIP8-like [Iris pallida]|uniref:RING-type E3 ubiquitin transferase n=1 Tax=Iris pallida TaxID=29817 RepID=A0AAX6HN01_IRIPA|nr:E3 ubiquitin-protein ligase CIP8-like [Iris pallida]
MDDEDDDDNRREIEIGDDFGWGSGLTSARARIPSRRSKKRRGRRKDDGGGVGGPPGNAAVLGPPLRGLRRFLLGRGDYDDVLFVLLQEQEASLKGGPPAARSVVEGLPTVDLNKEEIGDCAVCKDEFSAEEKAKRLPCRHYYHEECILPWLGMRNTCPLCRYELPTDDADYESRKARRAGSGGLEEEG